MCSSSSSNTENSNIHIVGGNDRDHGDHDLPLAVATVCLPEDDCHDMTELELGTLPPSNDLHDSTTARASSSTAGDNDIPVAIATPRRNATNSTSRTTSSNNNTNLRQDSRECATWKKNLLFAFFCLFTFLVLPYSVYRITGAIEGSADDNADGASWGNHTNTTRDDDYEYQRPRRTIAPFSLP